jgi:hypothetical protein
LVVRIELHQGAPAATQYRISAVSEKAMSIRRVMELVAALHCQGYGRLRLACSWENAGPAPVWFGDIVPVACIQREHGARLADWRTAPYLRERMPRYLEDERTGIGNANDLPMFTSRRFGRPGYPWPNFLHQTREQSAEEWLSLYPNLAAEGVGADPEYVAWYARMLEATAPTGVIAATRYWEEPPGYLYVSQGPSGVDRVPLPPPGGPCLGDSDPAARADLGPPTGLSKRAFLADPEGQHFIHGDAIPTEWAAEGWEAGCLGEAARQWARELNKGELLRVTPFRHFLAHGLGADQVALLYSFLRDNSRRPEIHWRQEFERVFARCSHALPPWDRGQLLDFYGGAVFRAVARGDLRALRGIIPGLQRYGLRLSDVCMRLDQLETICPSVARVKAPGAKPEEVWTPLGLAERAQLATMAVALREMGCQA